MWYNAAKLLEKPMSEAQIISAHLPANQQKHRGKPLTWVLLRALHNTRDLQAFTSQPKYEAHYG